jgi:hypothetical protein
VYDEELDSAVRGTVTVGWSATTARTLAFGVGTSSIVTASGGNVTDGASGTLDTRTGIFAIKTWGTWVPVIADNGTPVSVTYTPATATLTVTDAEGDVQTFSIPISIGNKPPVPVITSTVNSLDGIPSGTIEWDGSQSYDPDGNATNTGPAPVTLYEWVLTDANGVLSKQDSLQIAGTKAILPNPGIDRAGVYTVALTVTDLSVSTVMVIQAMGELSGVRFQGSAGERARPAGPETVPAILFLSGRA